MSAFAALWRRELGALFATPLGWSIAAAYWLVQGLLFWTALTALSAPGAPPGRVLELLFGGNLYFWVAQLFFVPLLTSRVLAGERASGLLEALLTTPVSAAAVVTAKFLAVYVYYLALWLPTLCYVLFLAAHSSVDAGPVASGYLGVAVVGAALVGVGVLASALSPGPVVAGATALAALLALFGVSLAEPHLPALSAVLDQLSLPAAMAGQIFFMVEVQVAQGVTRASKSWPANRSRLARTSLS